MRIIEPSQLHQRSKKRAHAPRRGVVLLLLVIVSAGLLWQASRSRANPQPVQAVQVPPKPAPVPPAPTRYRKFTGVQFRDLYNSFAYPNTKEIIVAPSISGNTVADARIRAIAFERGYRLRSVPVAPLSKTPEGFAVQQKVVEPWQKLRAAAAKEGIDIGLVSAFRSVDEQRLIFLQELKAKGVTIDAVATGQADELVDAVLKTTSIPGYSRHHTGYAVDFKCNNEDFNFFANTECFAWLKKNNYQNAKKFGWIPSYPPDVDNQGPDPEAWEYVWLGAETLLETSN